MNASVLRQRHAVLGAVRLVVQVEILQQPGHPEASGGYPTSDSQEELLGDGENL